MSSLTVTKERQSYSPRHFLEAGKAKSKFAGVMPEAHQLEACLNDLPAMGAWLHKNHIQTMFESFAQDSAHGTFGLDDYVNPLTTPSITTPIQFLQHWLPGFVHVITQARTIDVLVGMSVQGDWQTEEVVQGVMELIGSPALYGDYTNTPLSSWNTNFERRTVVRFEEGLRDGVLEDLRAAAMNVNNSASKRIAAALVLEIKRNQIGFYGFNNGLNRTYGLLNDPNNPAYVTVAIGASGFTQWNTKTFDEITGDIRSWYAALRLSTGGNLQDDADEVTLAIALSVYDQLTKTTSANGYSVMAWLRDSYPNTRVVNVPEFDGADGGENVAYLYLESASKTPDDINKNTSTDDMRTYIQPVPAKFQTVGVQKLAKGTVESYSNATAGVMLKRPYNVYRASGI